MVRYRLRSPQDFDAVATPLPQAPIRHSQGDRKAQNVIVWDLPVRLFHWMLVALIVALYVTAKTAAMDLHALVGYATLALLLFRLVWGLVGTTYARFSNFIYAPPAIWTYARRLFDRRDPPYAYIGHNPLGGLSVVIMLACLTIQNISGLFADDDVLLEGPLARFVSTRTSDWLTRLHKTGFYVLLVLIVLHVAAILFYALIKKENLVRPMITGGKDVALPPNLPKHAPVWLAAVVFVLSAFAVYELLRI